MVSASWFDWSGHQAHRCCSTLCRLLGCEDDNALLLPTPALWQGSAPQMGAGPSHSVVAAATSGGWRKGNRTQMKARAAYPRGYCTQSRNGDLCDNSQGIFIIIFPVEICFNTKLLVINIPEMPVI